MVCFEIYLNGERKCRAGGENVWYIHTLVSYFKEKDRSSLIVNGQNDPTGEPTQLTESVQWSEETKLKLGDEIQIRVVESTEPDPFQVERSFGNRVHFDGEVEHFCTFCGKNARDVGMLIHPHANICNECLRRYQPK